MNAVIDRLTICAHTRTLHRPVEKQLLSIVSPLLYPSFLPLYPSLTQTNQFTCVLTPKSQSLTCPRVFTSILDGLTSAETNCLIKLQHQHSSARLYQLCSFFYNKPTQNFTHLCEVSSGSTNMSDLSLPRDTDNGTKKYYSNFNNIQAAHLGE